MSQPSSTSWPNEALQLVRESLARQHIPTRWRDEVESAALERLLHKPWKPRSQALVAKLVRWTFYNVRTRLPKGLDVPLSEEVEEGLQDPTEAARAHDLKELTATMLAELDEKDRGVLELHYLLGCTDAEVAQSQGLSEAAVRKRLERARKRAQDVAQRLGVSGEDLV